jgi:Na+/proline symporter
MQTALVIDGIVVAIYFAVIVGIGLRAGRGSDSLQEFTLGGHKIPWWAVLASIIAAETSAATFLGAPAEWFKTRSFAYAQLATDIFIAPYYKHKVPSIFEFLDLRFGPHTRNTASAIFLVTRVLGIGVSPRRDHRRHLALSLSRRDGDIAIHRLPGVRNVWAVA